MVGNAVNGELDSLFFLGASASLVPTFPGIEFQRETSARRHLLCECSPEFHSAPTAADRLESEYLDSNLWHCCKLR